MRKRIKRIEQKITGIVKKTNITGILPFQETPAEGRHQGPKEGPASGELQASDLFSLFTADIIKQQTLFTR